MRWIDILRLRLRSIFLRRHLDRDLDDEIRYHLDRQIEMEIAGGRTPDEARYAALRSLRDPELRKQECRDARGVNLLSNFEQDLHYALRQLRKNPGFTITAILVLALGLCASVAIFAFANAALLRPLPYRDPGRLVGVYEYTPQCHLCNLSYLDFLDWKKLNTVFSSFSIYSDSGFLLSTPSGAEPVLAARVTAGFFDTLGVRPALGRDFNSNEDRPGAPHVVMLSYAAWQKRYGGNRKVVGQSILLDGAPYTVIGVLPESFQFAPVHSAELWATVDTTTHCLQRRSCHNLYGIARLKDGVSIETAVDNTKWIARQLEKQYPDSNRGQSANVISLRQAIVGDVRPILLILLSGAGLLLLIAYFNTAGLLLVRSEGRRREIAVRGALGASKPRLTLQFVTEGIVLVAAGSLAGLFAAHWAIELLIKLIPADMLADMPYLRGLGLDWHVLAFAAAMAVLAAIVFAITPILHFFRSELRAGLNESSRGSASTAWRRTGSKLVAFELATAMVLLIGAGLLSRSLYNLLNVSLGFESDHLATLHVYAQPTEYSTTGRQIALAREVLDGVSALPGVKSAALSSLLPVSFNGNTIWIRVVGHPYNGQHNEVNERDVSSSYFTTLHAKLLRGRFFTDADDQSKPKVAIINEAFARKYFPGEDPIGKKVGDNKLTPDSICTVVGIVDNIREGSLDSEIWPAQYFAFNQSPDNAFQLVVRTSQSERSLLPTLVATIHNMNAGIATYDEMVMSDKIEDSPSAYLHRSSAWLVAGFAVLALFLGVIGLYGVVAYSVGQRTREIGVRMALGAEPRLVYRLVLKEAFWLALIGSGIGIVCSLLSTKLLHGLLFGVQSWDFATLVAVTALLVFACLIASYLPARRAAMVNPMEALRAE